MELVTTAGVDDDLMSKPVTRSGHVSVAAGNYILVWGGYTKTTLMHGGVLIGESDTYLPPVEVWVYHCDFDKWAVIETTGDVPHGLSGACAVSVPEEKCVYVMCGHCGQTGNVNDIYRLDLQHWSWEFIEIADEALKPSPRDKFVAWEYRSRVYIFGGFGPPTDDFLNENGGFFYDTETLSRGWNNQLHIFDPVTASWSNPKCRGCVPSPRAALAAAKIGHYVYMFGGRHNMQRLNDLYRLDLDTLCFEQLMSSSSDIPIGRSWHSFTAVSDNVIYLYGGFSQDQVPLGDAWLLDVQTLQWCQLHPTSSIPPTPLLWHTACRTADGDIVIFGGCSSNILSLSESVQHTNRVMTFRISPKSLFRLCLDAAYQHRSQLQSQWPMLPRQLYTHLNTRLHRFPRRNAREMSVSGLHQGRMCTVQ